MALDSLWYALQVRPSRERFVEAGLSAKGYNVFLPTYRRRAGFARSVRETDRAVFPGYLFCRFAKDGGAGKVVTTPGVLRIVGYGRSAAAIDETTISAIQTIVRSGVAQQTWRYLTCGSRIRVASGPLTGVEGILLSQPGENRLVISVNILQRSVAVLLDNNTAFNPLN